MHMYNKTKDPSMVPVTLVDTGRVTVRGHCQRRKASSVDIGFLFLDFCLAPQRKGAGSRESAPQS